MKTGSARQGPLGGDSRCAAAQTRADLVPSVARAFVGLAEDRGCDGNQLCRGLGFNTEDLAQHELLLSHQQVRTLILRTARRLDDPSVGLAAGARQTPTSWGLTGLGLMTCPTLGDAIAYGLEHRDITGAMVDNWFETGPQHFTMEASPRRYDPEIEPYLAEENFASSLAVARCLAGADLKPSLVEFAHRSPGGDAAYRRFFACPVRFGAGVNRIHVETRWLNVRVPHYDRLTCSLLQRQLETMMRTPPGLPQVVQTVVDRLRTSSEAATSQQQLAEDINLSARTLRRRLQREATGYKSLRDEALYARARDLLSSPGTTVDQVAATLGYSDARAFRRAFKRWSGQSPGTYRRGH